MRCAPPADAPERRRRPRSPRRSRPRGLHERARLSRARGARPRAPRPRRLPVVDQERPVRRHGRRRVARVVGRRRGEVAVRALNRIDILTRSLGHYYLRLLDTVSAHVPAKWSPVRRQGHAPTRYGGIAMADHNDPNAVNSIFSDIDVSAADLYDIFGFPSDDRDGGEKVFIALTFSAVPKAGTLDPDLLYRVRIAPDRRITRDDDDQSLAGLLRYFDGVKNKYLSVLKPAEIRVTVDPSGRATVKFMGFAGGSFTQVIDTNKSLVLKSPRGHAIKIYVGGRDDAFFN